MRQDPLELLGRLQPVEPPRERIWDGIQTKLRNRVSPFWAAAAAVALLVLTAGNAYAWLRGASYANTPSVAASEFATPNRLYHD